MLRDGLLINLINKKQHEMSKRNKLIRKREEKGKKQVN